MKTIRVVLSLARLEASTGARLWRSPAAACSTGLELCDDPRARVVCCRCGWASPQPRSVSRFQSVVLPKFALLSLALLAALPLHAQVVNDGATNTLSNVTNNSPTITVGTNGSFTLLVLSNNAVLNNTLNGVIGRNASAQSNEVRLVSATARWTMAAFSDLFIGSNGASSRLTVSGGALVQNAFNANIGQRSSSSNNSVLVTDPGSLWSSFLLNVGNAGAFNQLTVSNGATVWSGGGTVGFGPTASNNLVTVTGAGSIWTNDGGLIVGSFSSGNRVIVSAGGRLANISGAVGQDSAATNNTVIVSDTGSSWTNLGILRVGDSGSGNRLVISNGSLVHSSGIGTVGLNSTAQSNSVTVADPGSIWAIGSDLYVGSNGSGNLLAISNGGFVVNSNAFLGASNSASGNSALVVGAGTLWSNRNNLVVGNFGIGNQVIVSNGAQVVARFSYAGYAGSSRSNLVFISGTGTVWSNDFSFYLGASGSANQLVVSNGALLTGSTGGIGISTSSSNNLAVVTGQGTRWDAIGGGMGVGIGGSGNRLVISNDATVFDFAGTIGTSVGSVNNEALVSDGHWSTDSLSIGYEGAGSRLIITNNGVVFSDRAIFVGSELSSSNNRVVVDGGSMRTVNGSGRLDVRRGTNVFNAGLIEANQLMLTNTRGFFEFNGGTLITHGAVINNGLPFVIGRSGTKPAIWDVRAGATNHLLFSSLIVGDLSSFNQLLVTNGGLLTGPGATIGAGSVAKSNAAIVAGPGSRWEMNSLVLGASGSFNQLVVSNGGWVSNNFNTIGSGLPGGNTVLVTGAGSVLTNANIFTVGSFGSSNQVVVSDGGTLRAIAPSVCSAVSSNNTVLVTGSNALWQSSFLAFGSDGPGNQLVVSNGGRLWSGSTQFGFNSGGSNNLAVVTGPGSMWTNGSLNIGRFGKGNRVIVSNGGAMQGSAFIGFEMGCSNNALLVTDSGSTFNGDLYSGFYGGRNQLVISNGATASGNYGVVGFQITGTNNLATITGPGSTWSNALEFEVGLFSRGNQLVVSNGATLASAVGFIGYDFSANANSAFVTDSGTRWLLSSNLYVGSNGSLSRLIITNGARVANRAGFIGTGSSSISNTVTVTGPGSVWTNSLELVVGQSGFGNQLVVSNGGSVVNGVGYFGIESSSSSNVVIVTGAGSAWTNRTSLSMGVLGNGNRLIVTNGGTLRSGVCEIGSNGSSGNEAVITDAGSLWFVSSLLFAGSVGNGNRLILTNGGRVLSFGARIGYSGSDNLTVITGPGSGWTNFSGFLVGESGPRSILILTNGGQILEAQGFITGVNPSSINNRVVVDGGTLRVQNLDGSAFEVRRGTNVLNSGLVEVARLLVTNVQGFFEFNGGTLSSENSQLSNGIAFRIGNGVSPATFILAGNGLHDFTGVPNATVSSNATLMGNGTIAGSVILSAGSTLAPGASIGQLTFSNSPSLHGKLVMEISKDVPQGGITNDQIQAIGTLTYGGTLTVTNIGTNALAVGDRFQLFKAPAYAGFFSAAVSLPPLNAGLSWANRLFVDGSIEVIGLSFTQISVSGNSLLLAGAGGTPGTPFAILTATNVTEPLSNWLSIVTNQFNPAGRFTFSNGITAGETQRFFRIRTP